MLQVQDERHFTLAAVRCSYSRLLVRSLATHSPFSLSVCLSERGVGRDRQTETDRQTGRQAGRQVARQVT